MRENVEKNNSLGIIPVKPSNQSATKKPNICATISPTAHEGMLYEKAFKRINKIVQKGGGGEGEGI